MCNGEFATTFDDSFRGIDLDRTLGSRLHIIRLATTYMVGRHRCRDDWKRQRREEEDGMTTHVGGDKQSFSVKLLWVRIESEVQYELLVQPSKRGFATRKYAWVFSGLR